MTQNTIADYLMNGLSMEMIQLPGVSAPSQERVFGLMMKVEDIGDQS
jgi:hypothetical protein